MAKKKNPHTQRLKGLLAASALRLIALLPFSLNQRLAALLGWLLGRLPSSTRSITEVNLRLCFPELDPQQHRRLVQRSLQEDLLNSFAFASFWRNSEHALSRIAEVRGFDEFQARLEQHQPVIILAPHLGCWEVANLWLARHCDLHVMFAPSQFPEVDALIKAGRQREGSVMYPATARGVAGLVRAVRNGAVTAILPDQVPARGSGLYVPFFTHNAYTGTLACKLIKQTGAVGFVLWAERLAGNQGYRLHFSKADPAIAGDDLESAVRALNRDIERVIRLRPEQYLWSYKRFRRSPPGQPSHYKKSS